MSPSLSDSSCCSSTTSSLTASSWTWSRY
jgi:hypothetical protein